jgi:ATP-dependent DNA ligase
MPPPKSKASFIAPTLCLVVPSLPESKEWEYELKLDGHRALTFKTHGKVSSITQQQRLRQPLPSNYPGTS